MTASSEGPPEEPSGSQPEEPWQPPSPPPQQPAQPPPTGQYPGYGPPYDRPPGPPGANPYGGGTVSYYQPIESGGMASGLKVVLGVLIGLFGGFFMWFVALIGFADSTGGGNEIFFYAAVAPLVIPAPLLIWKATRPWAVGLLIGTAVSSIGLSSFCAAILGPGGL